jgi:hypothetical protein
LLITEIFAAGDNFLCLLPPAFPLAFCYCFLLFLICCALFLLFNDKITNQKSQSQISKFLCLLLSSVSKVFKVLVAALPRCENLRLIWFWLHAMVTLIVNLPLPEPWVGHSVYRVRSVARATVRSLRE